MRGAGIGLLLLLVGVAIVFLAMFSGPNGGYVPTVMKSGDQARQQAEQVSGHAPDGRPVQDTIVLDEVDEGGQFRRLKVVTVDAAGPMVTAYHLQAGDEITRVGGMKVTDNNDAGLAKALVYEAYQRNQSIDYLRNGQEMSATPDSPLTKFQPDKFNAPGTVQKVPSH